MLQLEPNDHLTALQLGPLDRWSSEENPGRGGGGIFFHAVTQPAVVDVVDDAAVRDPAVVDVVLLPLPLTAPVEGVDGLGHGPVDALEQDLLQERLDHLQTELGQVEVVDDQRNVDESRVGALLEHEHQQRFEEGIDARIRGVV